MSLKHIIQYDTYIRENNENVNSDEKNYSKVAKTLIKEVVTSLVLLNNEFLDDLLDKHITTRYVGNSNMFLTDIKNLLIEKNRLCLGKITDGVCTEDTEVSKLNRVFSYVVFDMQNDWNVLIDSRIMARNIIDKLYTDKKLSSADIKKIYWIGVNKMTDDDCDIVIEMTDGQQHFMYLNKNLSVQKTTSFTTFAESLMNIQIDNLYQGEYLNIWDDLTRNWVRILYTNARKEVQVLIEKFVDYNRLNDITYTNYYDITIKDEKYQYLGEYFAIFDKNYKSLSKLLSDVWKNRERCFDNPLDVYNEWEKTKIMLLNSKILEKLLTQSLGSTYADDVKKVDSKWKEATGKIKMKFIKTVVDKMGCTEHNTYYLSSNGNSFVVCPSKEFFRQNYENIGIKFDYHVNLTVNDDDSKNDFTIDVEMGFKNYLFLRLFVIVGFGGGEMSGSLKAKYKFELPEQFNYMMNYLSGTEE